MGNFDKKILNNIYQASKIGLDSIEFLYGKVKDEDLRNDMNEYAKKYYSILEQTRKNLKAFYDEPVDYSPVIKAMMWAGIQTKTISDASSSKIAEILIQGSTKGIVEMTKDINNEFVSEDVKKIAHNLINYEKENIQNVKKYL